MQLIKTVFAAIRLLHRLDDLEAKERMASESMAKVHADLANLKTTLRRAGE